MKIFPSNGWQGFRTAPKPLKGAGGMTMVRWGAMRVALLAILLLPLVGTALPAGAGPATAGKEFASPEEAVAAFVAAVKNHDEQTLLAIFGPEGEELVVSEDATEDRRRRERFTRDFEEKHALVAEGPAMVLVIGEREWPFPIPLVKQGEQWVFDTLAGKEEILNRRVGENELSTVQTLLAVVDAQREYAMEDRDGDGIREYAARFGSDPGTRNGLYWPTAEGEAPSPLGELVAEARAEGYSRQGQPQGPIPYHGYYFKMLTTQGAHATGGAFDYLVRDRMVGGFAVLAYPAGYGRTGVMTFMVNHDGVVLEKDLGPETSELASALTAFDPDESWTPVD